MENKLYKTSRFVRARQWNGEPDELITKSGLGLDLKQIYMLCGSVEIRPGDWIVVDGSEFRVVKDSVFVKKYEYVESESESESDSEELNDLQDSV